MTELIIEILPYMVITFLSIPIIAWLLVAISERGEAKKAAKHKHHCKECGRMWECPDGESCSVSVARSNNDICEECLDRLFPEAEIDALQREYDYRVRHGE